MWVLGFRLWRVGLVGARATVDALGFQGRGEIAHARNPAP